MNRTALLIAAAIIGSALASTAVRADQTLNLVCNTTARWPGYAGTQYFVGLDLEARTVNETQIYPNGNHTIFRPGDITFVSAGVIAGHLDSGIFPKDGLADAFSLNRCTGVLTLQESRANHRIPIPLSA